MTTNQSIIDNKVKLKEQHEMRARKIGDWMSRLVLLDVAVFIVVFLILVMTPKDFIPCVTFVSSYALYLVLTFFAFKKLCKIQIRYYKEAWAIQEDIDNYVNG